MEAKKVIEKTLLLTREVQHEEKEFKRLAQNIYKILCPYIKKSTAQTFAADLWNTLVFLTPERITTLSLSEIWREYDKHKRKGPNGRRNETESFVPELTKLGSKTTEYQYDEPSINILETFSNKNPNRQYQIEFIFPEFTSLCPKTGQPDFAIITIRYIPKEKCIESKSLKLYFFAFRSYGAFMEAITNKILDDLVLVCQPQWMEVVGQFNARGGTHINVTATTND